MNIHTRQRNQRLGLEHSTSPLAYAAHTGFIEALIASAITGLFGVTAPGWLVSGLTALATTAITFGLQYLLMPKPPRPADGKAPKVQAVPPVLFGCGTNRIAGSYVLWEEFEGALYAVTALCGHKISAIRRIWLHDDAVTTGAPPYAPFPDTPVVNGLDDGRYGASTVLIDTRLGEATETPYADFVANLSSGGVWTSNHRGDSTASLGMILTGSSAENFQKYYPYGICQPSIEGDLALVWDPRDEDQDPEDQETWTFSKNSALLILWWLCFCPFGPKWNYVKAILPVIDRWIEEADICDEDVPLAIGGTEKRYEANLWATTETDPIAFQNGLLASCDGHLAQYGDGTLVLTVGKFREELVETITDADIVGHYVQTDVPEEDEINRLVPRFTYPATDYSTALADYFEDTVAQSKVGRVLSQEADLQAVQQWRQARRLAIRDWRRLQQKKNGSFDLRLSAINASRSRWVRLQTPLRLPSLNSKLIENRRSILALMRGGYQMEWRLHPENIDAWNPETDEGAVPPVPARPNAEGLPTPAIDSVIAVGSSGSVYLRVAIVDIDRIDLAPGIRWRIKDIGGGTPGSWNDQVFSDWDVDSGLIALDTNPVPNDQLLEVEAFWVASGGTRSPYSTPRDEILATVDATAPLALLTFTASDGTGEFVANFATDTDAHLASVAIYKVASGGVLDPDSDKVAQPAVSPGISYAIPVATAAGAYDIYVQPLNRSGIPGPLSGPDAATVS